jgi:hypothetical protein
MVEYEIIANPEDYGIEALVEGLGGSPVDFPRDEREKWATEVGAFAQRLTHLQQKALGLQALLAGGDPLTATPASLKTLKIQLFKINDALNTSMNLVAKLDGEIVARQ